RAIISPLRGREFASALHRFYPLGADQGRGLAPRPLRVEDRLKREEVIHRLRCGRRAEDTGAEHFLESLKRQVGVAAELAIGDAVDSQRELVERRVAWLQPAEAQGDLPFPFQPRLALLGRGSDESERLERRDVTGDAQFPRSPRTGADLLRPAQGGRVVPPK